MTPRVIKRIFERNRSDLAFIIGNGINRYPNDQNGLSWENLMVTLWGKVSFQTLTQRPKGISLTEFYDILELENTQDINLQKEVADLLANWDPLNHHKTIITKIRELNVPVLTTNFDKTIAKSFDYKPMRTQKAGSSFVYPWTFYHGNTKLNIPTRGFGVWYINGLTKYPRSIRLGLSQFMGSVERARNLIHKGDEENLYSGKNVSFWSGHKTWLHIIFNKSLFIFGLGLEENETFLRWLLIERIRYFKKFPARKHKGWYLSKRNSNNIDHGKKFFLEKVGFEVIEVDSYDDIYQNIWS